MDSQINIFCFIDTEEKNFQVEKESYEDMCGHYISRCLFLILSVRPYWEGRFREIVENTFLIGFKNTLVHIQV